MAPRSKKMSAEDNKRVAQPEDALLGERIRALRNAAKISQQELGEKLDPPVSFQQIQKYEKGVNRVTFVRLQQIAAILGCTLDDFAAGKAGGISKQGNEMIAMVGDPILFRAVKALAGLPRPIVIAFTRLVENVAGNVTGEEDAA